MLLLFHCSVPVAEQACSYLRISAATSEPSLGNCRGIMRSESGKQCRYFRFFSDGTCLTRTSPEPLRKIWQSLHKMPNYIEKKDSRLPGRWKVQVGPTPHSPPAHALHWIVCVSECCCLVPIRVLASALFCCVSMCGRLLFSPRLLRTSPTP